MSGTHYNPRRPLQVGPAAGTQQTKTPVRAGPPLVAEGEREARVFGGSGSAEPVGPPARCGQLSFVSTGHLQKSVT